MRARGRSLVLWPLVVFLSGSALSPAQRPVDIGRELDEAKLLFGAARYREAVARLQAALVSIERHRDVRSRRSQAASACLELGFAYLGIEDRRSARVAFECVALLDRRRRLDPRIHAPTAVSLFEEARAGMHACREDEP